MINCTTKLLKILQTTKIIVLAALRLIPSYQKLQELSTLFMKFFALFLNWIKYPNNDGVAEGDKYN